MGVKASQPESLSGNKGSDDKPVLSDPAMDMFFRMSPDLLCVSSTGGYFIKLNPAWETTLGFTLEELMSKPFIDFIHPDDVKPTYDEFNKELEGQEVINFVNRYRC